MIHYKLNSSSKIVSNLNVEYDLQGKEQIVTSSHQGASGTSFATKGIDNGYFSYDAGIGYEKDFNEASNLKLSR
jgi:hypothetical protein